MKYAWMKAQVEFKVTAMCLILNVSKTGYYAWCSRSETEREKESKLLSELIKEIFGEQRNGSGTRTIKKALGRKNHQVSRRRIGRLMRAQELFCKTKKKFKATTNSKHDKPIAPNRLNREFTATKPNQKWVGDITSFGQRKVGCI